MSEWKPIETAPKDGTKIIVGRNYGSSWDAAVVSWDKGCQDWYLETTVFGYEIDGESIYPLLSDTQNLSEPTHWLLLPEPPQA